MRVMVVTMVGLVAAGLLFGAVGFGEAATVVKTAPSAAVVKTPAKAVESQPEPPTFRVPSIQQLQSMKQGIRRLRITGPGEKALPLAGITMQAMDPAAGCPDYASGSGVVLRPLQPWHEPSGSTLILRGVYWNERVRQQVAAGDADTSFALYIGRELTLGTNAYFQNLPGALHTYMLTIGTSAPRERLRIRIGESFSQPSSLVANPETNEVRALFTYEAGRHENGLAVYVHYLPAESESDHVYFHHIQLAQLD